MEQIWSIKIAVEKDSDYTSSGDYNFANSLAKSLRSIGVTVFVDFADDWSKPHGENVILILRGLASAIIPEHDKSTLYIMWNISHPNLISIDEYNSYDLVCVSSQSYANQLKQVLDVPVLPLLQCTDTTIFHPPLIYQDTSDSDFVFIGNSRNKYRSSIKNAVRANLTFRLWGNDWEQFIDNLSDYLTANSIENNRIPEIFHTSKATFNDHWEDMLTYNYINNRVFDALACGIPIITDYHEELHSLFPNEILFYHNYKEFLECIKELNENYFQYKQSIQKLWPTICSKYSFDSRAKALQALADVLFE